MSNAAQNPYAAPVDNSTAIDTQPPFSTYLYAAVLFFIGSCATGFGAFVVAAIAAAVWDPAIFLVWLTIPAALVGGGVAARVMFRRLSELHRKKVELQMADAERLGEFYTW